MRETSFQREDKAPLWIISHKTFHLTVIGFVPMYYAVDGTYTVHSYHSNNYID